MHRKEVNERSPIRLLEASIHGGLGKGNLGVIIARHGVGKTAFLVGIALDDLMRGRQVLHVSLEHTGEKVRAYYDEIFADLAHHARLEDVWKVRVDLERNRRIHCYLGGTFSIEKLRSAITFDREHGDFHPSAIMIDGLDFDALSHADVDALRAVAGELGSEVWTSAVTHRESPVGGDGVPEPVARLADGFDVILRMAHDTKAVHVSLLKDHDNPKPSDLRVALDPTTMLLMQES